MAIVYMLQPINDLPAHVIGIHAYADVSVKEYEEELIPLIDQLIKRKSTINLILVLETDIAGFSPGNWCGSVNIGLKYFFRWRKVAVVTDQKEIKGFSDLFKYIIPGQYRVFPLERIDKALIWVAENNC